MNCDVSVIIPTYNSSETLQRALDSVYSQSLLPREIIVVDDGSDDWEKSKRIAASYLDSVPIHFIHVDQNQGPSTARNIGITAAGSGYLAFLDSDDVWFKDKIALQYEVMTRYNLGLSMHGYRQEITDQPSDSENSRDLSPLSLSPLSFWNFVFGNPATPTVMIKRQKMASFDSSLRRCEDWKCWVESIAKPGGSAVYIRRVLAGGFKRGCGMAGLSQDLEAMHGSKMLVLKKLSREGTIGRFQYLVGVGVETMKYPVRVLRVWLRNRTGFRHTLKSQAGSNSWKTTKY